MDTPPAAPAARTLATGDARLFDAMLAEMDRGLRAELVSDRAQFIYDTLRRILVRQIVHRDGAPPFGELGTAAASIDPSSLQPDELKAAALREASRLDDIEAAIDARYARVAEPAAGADAFDATTVERYLRGIGGPHVAVTAFKVLAGGRSKQTILLTVSGLDAMPPDLVIRRDLHAGATGTTVIDEHRMLTALADHGAPVPRPYLLEPSALGRPFMLMQRVDGRLRGDIMTAPPSAAAVLDSAGVLGRLHALPVDDVQSSLADHVRASSQTPLRDQIAALQTAWWDKARDPSAVITLAFRWLLDRAGRIVPARAIVHGDYNYHNLLYDGDRLTAVLDWELGRVGHPAEDLGYIRTVATSIVPWDRFMAAYVAGGGHHIDDPTVLFYAMLGTLRLMVLILQARFVVESGMSDDLQLAEVALYHLPKLAQKLSVELRLALAMQP